MFCLEWTVRTKLITSRIDDDMLALLYILPAEVSLIYKKGFGGRDKWFVQ